MSSGQLKSIALKIGKLGKRLRNKGPIEETKVREYEHQIVQMTYKLYGLTAEEIKVAEK